MNLVDSLVPTLAQPKAARWDHMWAGLSFWKVLVLRAGPRSSKGTGTDCRSVEFLNCLDSQEDYGRLKEDWRKASRRKGDI